MELTMRGKKTDPVFVSEFIQECVALGLLTSDDIVKHAKKLVDNIDEEIKAIEKKKSARSKLLDVIASFEKQSKDKTEEAELLPFFNLQYPETCRKICKDIVSISPDGTYLITGIKDAETLFCIKQLIEAKVVARVDYHLVRGERFDKYIKFVLREAQ